MIYILATALVLTFSGFALKARRSGLRAELTGAAAAALCGLAAGLFIGIGARLGMLAITLANGDAFRFSVSGTLTVIGVFSLLGIVFGLIYESLFRSFPVRFRGFVFGLIIILFAWYPLALAALQDLTFQPGWFSLLFFSGVCVSIMFLPFGITLEYLLSRFRRDKKNSPKDDGAVKHS